MSTRTLFSAPNIVSLLRLLMAPVLFILAFQQHTTLYFIAIGFTVFTDLLDGFLARALNQITVLGSQLDSWGDFTIYTTLALCAWLVWPEIVLEYRYACLTIVLSFTLPALVGLIKYKGLTSYHTWSVKLAVGMTVISYILLFANIVGWPFVLAAIACAVAALEETMITLILDNKRPDIRTVWQAVLLRRTELR